MTDAAANQIHVRPRMPPQPDMRTAPTDAAQWRQVSLDHENAGLADAALAAAWAALEAAPADARAKKLVARLLKDNPKSVTADREAGLHALLIDEEIDPGFIGPAACTLLAEMLHALSPSASERMVAWLEASALAQDLLRETYVTRLDVEMALTALRRWLLLSGRWPEFPRSVAALTTQAMHNQGAWLFDREERAALAADIQAPIARCYLPRIAASTDAKIFGDDVTRAVADQYEQWPYPVWSRVMVSKPTTLPRLVEALDPGGPATLPQQADVLVAGCGTGREAALWARQLPDARITAIDLSRTSLRYAQDRCTGPDLRNIAFQRHDLNTVAELGRQFDVIICSGVLHHLPDPEKGWQALRDVLKPGGIMRVMVYSWKARIRIRAVRNLVADVAAEPIDDDTLREVRRHLIERARGLVCNSLDFYTLSGIHDLLLHRHEDPFDVPRIQRAIEALGLNLLRFDLPSRAQQARYLRTNPADVHFRDLKAWAKLERDDPFVFSKMHDFWCRKPHAAM